MSKPSLTNCPKLLLHARVHRLLAVIFCSILILIAPIRYVTDILGGYSVGVPPLPIPNRVVKPDNADGTVHKTGE